MMVVRLREVIPNSVNNYGFAGIAPAGGAARNDRLKPRSEFMVLGLHPGFPAVNRLVAATGRADCNRAGQPTFASFPTG